MAHETNGTSLRGTNAKSRLRKKLWLKRLLKVTFWIVWAIDKVLTFVAWATGNPPS